MVPRYYVWCASLYSVAWPVGPTTGSYSTAILGNYLLGFCDVIGVFVVLTGLIRRVGLG